MFSLDIFFAFPFSYGRGHRTDERICAEHLIVETANYMQVAERVVMRAPFLGIALSGKYGDYASGTKYTCRQTDMRKLIAV